MTYKETLEFLFSQLPMFQRVGASAYKANLDNTIKLCNLLSNPQLDFPSIHVAGTNGKGSTSSMIASILQEAGFKVGLYTSPHLVDFRERIRVNGEMIPEQDVVDFVGKYRKDFTEISPSFFELTFALSMDYFAKSRIDIAVVEVGMGGRLDSTNIIKSVLSIITNISLDHTQFLGDTIEKIAIEKAGIIKQATPVLIGRKQPGSFNIFKEKASEMNSEIYFAEEIAKSKISENIVNVMVNGDRIGVRSPLLGNYQTENISTVFAAFKIINEKNILGKTIEIQTIKTGIENTIKNTKLRGRWETLSVNPWVICDTGHNVDGVKNVISQLKTLNFTKLHFVLGMVNDKDIIKILEMLPSEATYYFCKSNIPRGHDAPTLALKALEFNLVGDVFDSVSEAFNTACKNSKTGELVFVGGSTFTVAEVIEYSNNTLPNY